MWIVLMWIVRNGHDYNGSAIASIATTITAIASIAAITAIAAIASIAAIATIAAIASITAIILTAMNLVGFSSLQFGQEAFAALEKFDASGL
jgi:hypothetical protein